MEGLRKIIMAAVTLLLETGVFLFAVFYTKACDGGMLTAYFIAVGSTLAVFTTGNVASKVIGKPAESTSPTDGAQQ